jgi:hypothetical protein
MKSPCTRTKWMYKHYSIVIQTQLPHKIIKSSDSCYQKSSNTSRHVSATSNSKIRFVWFRSGFVENVMLQHKDIEVHVSADQSNFLFKFNASSAIATFPVLDEVRVRPTL